MRAPLRPSGPETWAVPELSAHLVLRGAGALIAPLRAVLRDWSVVPVQGTPPGPGIAIRHREGAYERCSPWTEAPRRFRDPVDAVCDLVVDLVHAYVAARPERLCLHAAAVETASGILLIPSTYRSGKSTLATALAARGARLFSDDVAPLGPAGEVEALGMLPRLRLPLPAGLGAAAQALTAAHPGPTSARYRYLALDAAGLAPRGTRRPVAAIVTLERAEGAAPALMEGDADHALQHLLLRNFARGPLPSRIFLRLRRLAAAVPCYRLRYGEAAEGAALLAERFAPLAPREVLDRAG